MVEIQTYRKGLTTGSSSGKLPAYEDVCISSVLHKRWAGQVQLKFWKKADDDIPKFLSSDVYFTLVSPFQPKQLSAILFFNSGTFSMTVKRINLDLLNLQVEFKLTLHHKICRSNQSPHLLVSPSYLFQSSLTPTFLSIWGLPVLKCLGPSENTALYFTWPALCLKARLTRWSPSLPVHQHYFLKNRNLFLSSVVISSYLILFLPFGRDWRKKRR